MKCWILSGRRNPTGTEAYDPDEKTKNMKKERIDMGKTLYLECNSGISGDMTVAALLDLGASEAVLTEVLGSVPVDGFSLEISRVKKAGIDCCDFLVVLDKEHENHDHDMEYLHGHKIPKKEQADCNIQERSQHEEAHGHHHEHHHEHRGLKEITEIIDQTVMSDKARSLAKRIFRILAEAEAKAHATDIDHVHFHEVGAVDSIVDIIAAAVCIDNLDIERVIVPKLSEGCGTVRCQHGILPIPVPAVANIMAVHHLNVEMTGVSGELVTPTGAAIAAALMTSDRLPESFRIEKIGLGAGKRTYERPSILRAMLIEETGESKEASIYKLETNIDDCTGEALGYTMERLFEAGARDVHYMPVFMKKNRPGWQLNVICDEAKIPEMEEIIFKETTTIGIRRIPFQRSVLNRKNINVQTPYGEASVKICDLNGVKKIYPEYESIVKICREQKLSYREVYDLIQRDILL